MRSGRSTTLFRLLFVYDDLKKRDRVIVDQAGGAAQVEVVLPDVRTVERSVGNNRTVNTGVNAPQPRPDQNLLC